MIKCRECGTLFQKISSSHLKKHKLTMKEYRSRYPSAPVLCRALLEEMRSEKSRSRSRAIGKRSCSIRWSKPEQHELQSKLMTALNSDSDFSSKRTAATKRSWQNSEYRHNRLAGYRQWCDTNEARQEMSNRANKFWSDPKNRTKQSIRATSQWLDPDYRELMKPMTDKWYSDEIVVRDWLISMGYYMSGSRNKIGFLPHGWLPTKKFTANADFVDYNHRLIIHVDGWSHFNDDYTILKDIRLDRWCFNNGWLFLRLSDTDVLNRPKWCRNMIRLLVKYLIIPVIR